MYTFNILLRLLLLLLGAGEGGGGGFGGDFGRIWGGFREDFAARGARRDDLLIALSALLSMRVSGLPSLLSCMLTYADVC
jgi:hypothetical protein